jgi:rhodanese-related sulfurtransferase
MTKREVCASCLDFTIDKVVKSMDNMKPSWLAEHDYVREFINGTTNFKHRYPRDANVKMELSLGKKHANRKMLFWAADSKETTSPLIVDAKKAYNKFSNHGVTATNADGDVKLEFKCPQPYSTQAKNKTESNTYFRHVHFVFSNKEMTEWENQIYTKIVVCKFDFAKSLKMMKSGMYVVLNALPAQYYAKDHIPNSFNLFHKDIKKMGVSELQDWFKDVVRIHYPKLHTYIAKGRLDIYEVPILTYCAHSKCNASELAIEQLMKKGFVNIHEYKGGIQDYRKNIPRDNVKN